MFRLNISPVSGVKTPSLLFEFGLHCNPPRSPRFANIFRILRGYGYLVVALTPNAGQLAYTWPGSLAMFSQSPELRHNWNGSGVFFLERTYSMGETEGTASNKNDARPAPFPPLPLVPPQRVPLVWAEPGKLTEPASRIGGASPVRRSGITEGPSAARRAPLGYRYRRASYRGVPRRKGGIASLSRHNDAARCGPGPLRVAQRSVGEWREEVVTPGLTKGDNPKPACPSHKDGAYFAFNQEWERMFQKQPGDPDDKLQKLVSHGRGKHGLILAHAWNEHYATVAKPDERNLIQLRTGTIGPIVISGDPNSGEEAENDGADEMEGQSKKREKAGTAKRGESALL
ncbi:hypothetical protein K438DRAFT_1749478 [Mycena galopus ATCC 62051]|nr:hypothetical protein K438DRAFT_1749478 [Mycena galopus ATCC 62051]